MYEEARAESCGATVTVRLIRSFEYRSIKYVVFKDVSLEQTAEDFMDFVVSGKSLSSKMSYRSGTHEGFPSRNIYSRVKISMMTMLLYCLV